MENKELLPCPFCGERGETEKIQEDCYGVGCGSCDFQLMSGPVGIGWHSSREDAISAWNTRTPSATQPAQGDAVRDAWRAEVQAANALMAEDDAMRQWLNRMPPDKQPTESERLAFREGFVRAQAQRATHPEGKE